MKNPTENPTEVLLEFRRISHGRGGGLSAKFLLIAILLPLQRRGKEKKKIALLERGAIRFVCLSSFLSTSR